MHIPDATNRLNNVTLSDPQRQRSDSASSGMSSASTCSVSSASSASQQTPYLPQQPDAQELMQFVVGPNRPQNFIDCDVYKSNASHTPLKNVSDNNRPPARPVKKEIKVQHMTTTDNFNGGNKIQVQTTPTRQNSSGMFPGQSDTHHHNYSHQHSYPSNMSHINNQTLPLRQPPVSPNVYPNYQNNSNSHTVDRYQQNKTTNSQYGPSSFTSSSQLQPTFPNQYSGSNVQSNIPPYYGPPHTASPQVPQHSSQATIFINKQNSDPRIGYNAGGSSPSYSHSPHGVHGSHSDPHLGSPHAVHVSHSDPHMAYHMQSPTNHQAPSSFDPSVQMPLSINVEHNPPDNVNYTPGCQQSYRPTYPNSS